MRILANMKIGTRLAIAFGLLVAFLLSVILIGVYAIDTSDRLTQDIVGTAWRKTLVANDIAGLANENSRLNFALLFTDDPTSRAQIRDNIRANKRQVDERYDELTSLLKTEMGKALLNRARVARKGYADSFNTAIQLADNDQRDQGVQTLLSDTTPLLATYIDTIGDLVDYENQQIGEAALRSRKTHAQLRDVMVGTSITVLLAAILLAFLTARYLTRTISRLRQTVRRVSEGDYEARVHLNRHDELGELGDALDRLLNERVAVLAKTEQENQALNESIIGLLSAVSALSKGDLSVKAPVTPDITGALADAINVMAESTGRTVQRVNRVSEDVRSASQKGREVVLSTAEGMNDIRDSIQETGKRIKRLGERSQEIGGIVRVINEIAERTSVLALNANMQAAMAGEAGRGFRVVADEVQRLAERSKEATDQIGKLVTGIQGDTNETMATMDRAIGKVVFGSELASKAAEQVNQLERLGDELVKSVHAFKVAEEADEGVLRSPILAIA